jgi:hypothetical protein
MSKTISAPYLFSDFSLIFETFAIEHFHSVLSRSKCAFL